MQQVVRAEVTNATLSEELDLTVSQISRLRNGKRNPSMATVHCIHIKLGWSDKDQMKAIRGKKFGDEFEKFLGRKYGE